MLTTKQMIEQTKLQNKLQKIYVSLIFLMINGNGIINKVILMRT